MKSDLDFPRELAFPVPPRRPLDRLGLDHVDAVQGIDQDRGLFGTRQKCALAKGLQNRRVDQREARGQGDENQHDERQLGIVVKHQSEIDEEHHKIQDRRNGRAGQQALNRGVFPKPRGQIARAPQGEEPHGQGEQMAVKPRQHRQAQPRTHIADQIHPQSRSAHLKQRDDDHAYQHQVQQVFVVMHQHLIYDGLHKNRRRQPKQTEHQRRQEHFDQNAGIGSDQRKKSLEGRARRLVLRHAIRVFQQQGHVRPCLFELRPRQFANAHAGIREFHLGFGDLIQDHEVIAFPVENGRQFRTHQGFVPRANPARDKAEGFGGLGQGGQRRAVPRDIGHIAQPIQPDGHFVILADHPQTRGPAIGLIVLLQKWKAKRGGRVRFGGIRFQGDHIGFFVGSHAAWIRARPFPIAERRALDVRCPICRGFGPR